MAVRFSSIKDELLDDRDREVESFSSEFASGSTSQAANIIEAIGAGAHLLLIDEDRAATNLMFADEGMRALMKGDDLTLTSFLERVRETVPARTDKEFAVTAAFCAGWCHAQVQNAITRLEETWLRFEAGSGQQP